MLIKNSHRDYIFPPVLREGPNAKREILLQAIIYDWLALDEGKGSQPR